MKRPRRRRRRSSKRDRIDVWRIVVWSGLTNLVLLSVFLAAQNFDLYSFGAARSEKQTEERRWAVNPQAALSSFGMTPKGDFSTSSVIVTKTGPDAATLDESVTEESTADLALAAGASADDSDKLRAAPILRKSADGKLEIGNFKSLSMVGAPGECLDFGDALLRDAGVADEKLDVVAATDEITIVRICTANGSIIVTCRGGQIAVSPRKSRPDDKCAKG